MTRKVRGPYIVIKRFDSYETYVQEWATPEEAIADADLSSGDVIAKVLDVKVVLDER